jgi:hypothetical protein
MRNSRTITHRQLAYSVSFVLALVLANSASAATILWDGGGGSQLWSDELNWNPDTMPGSDDSAQISIPDANCLIDSSVNAECQTLYVSRNAAPCYLNMTGGTLTTSEHIRIGEPSDSNGVFHLSGGTVSTSNTGRLWIGINGSGTVIITGGEMTVSNKLECGKNAKGTGYIYVHGGALNVEGYGSDDFELGKYGTGNIYLTGGEFNVTDKIKMGESGGSGHIYLYGGTINCGNDELLMSQTSTIDITEGTLVLQGDATSLIEQYVGDGRITAYGGLGRVVASYDGDETTVTGALADPELARNPSPSNFATIEWSGTGPTLSWDPGRYAVSHDVYFGTDRDDVNDASNTPGAWPEFKGNRDPCSYEPGPLDLGQTYYWRIDEVNDNTWAPPGSPWKGTVWEFTVADYIVVDNMESYGDITDPGPPPPPGSWIWYTWKDGEGWPLPSQVEGNGTGSLVDPNNGIVHGGIQSLKFFYDNDGTNVYNHGGKKYYSEIRADTSHLLIGPDWTAAGVKALELWFYGDPDNDANATEQMYVKLNGMKINYNGDMGDIRKASWQQWHVDLALFGIDLRNVTEIAIGFGNENNSTPSGAGVVYFDDIRLYPSRCLPSMRKPAGDLDNDCDVDYGDLDVMSVDWLEGDYNAIGSDGVLMNFPDDNSQWVNDPIRGRCLRLDGVDDWVDINDNQFSNFHNKTISVWANIREFPEPYPYLFCFRNAGDDEYRIYLRTRGESTVRVHFIEDYSADFGNAFANTWHHLAFVLRDTGSDTCTGEFYGDGALIDEMPNRPRHSGGARSVNLGSWNAGNPPFIAASIDDFRVYDAALSANEIKYLANVYGGVAPTAGMMLHYKFDEVSGLTAKNSSTYVFNRPLLSPAELYDAEPLGSRIVDFKDFAVLADMWLQEQLWP